MRDIKHIIVHCAATPPGLDIGAYEIRAWHTDPNRKGGPFADIGYHYVIRRSGAIEVGRPETQVGAHAQGHNKDSIGVCLVGGVRRHNGKMVAEDNFTPDQYMALKSLVQRLTARYPGAKTIGHRDVDRRKECPSFSVRDWLVRDNVLPDGIAWNSGVDVESPRPLLSTRTVGGAAVGGAAGLTAVGEAVSEAAQQAQAGAWAFPKLYLVLGLLVLVGTGLVIYDRWRTRQRTGV